MSAGCPSHDTLERVVSMVNPDFLKELNLSFETSSETTDFFRLIAVDGKTIRGNRGKHQSPTHIVTAYDGGNRLSLGQVAVEDKSNEITAIPRLLRQLNLRKSVVTIDAMGTQTENADTIISGDVQTFSQVVRGHWSVENLHWLLDVVYREDKNQTLDKRAAFNLNAIHKACLHLLQNMTFPYPSPF